MLINMSRTLEERGLDPCWTPAPVTRALANVENLPARIMDPCCGTGQICDALRNKHIVLGRDIVDYNWPGTVVADYLASSLNMGDMGIVTNPPYRLAFEFLGKALADGTQFIAFLLRLNFLESMKRKAFFELHPPSRVWISSRRFEMHSATWDGPRVSSNVCYSWMIWDRRKAYYGPTIGWFDHREFA